jgi:Amt family ammonium transporter
MGAQLIGWLFTFSWTFAIMFCYFWALNYFNMLRIDPLEEEVGMDISRHKGSAYDISGPEMQAVEDLSVRRASKHVRVEETEVVVEKPKEEDVEEVEAEMYEETA